MFLAQASNVRINLSKGTVPKHMVGSGTILPICHITCDMLFEAEQSAYWNPSYQICARMRDNDVSKDPDQHIRYWSERNQTQKEKPSLLNISTMSTQRIN